MTVKEMRDKLGLQMVLALITIVELCLCVCIGFAFTWLNSR
jgi:hypothetical protein